MNRHTFQCGLAVALGLTTTFLSLTQAQTPVLPSPLIAEQAVQTLALQKRAAAAPTRTLTLAVPAAQTRATAPRPQAAPLRGQVTYQKAASRARVYLVRSTAYNSIPNQTDSTPHITATGSRTRFGVVALSRDLLRQIPYGSRIKIEDLSGRYNRMLSGVTFRVEDTMNARIRGRVDVWMSTRSQAINWGIRSVRITVLP